MRVLEVPAFPVEYVKEDEVPFMRMSGPSRLAINQLMANVPLVVTMPCYLTSPAVKSEFMNEESEVSQVITENPTDDDIEPYATAQLPFGDSVDAADQHELGYTLWQPTSMHRRSFILEHPILSEGVEDEYGNTFTSFSIKGNNAARPGIIETSTAANRFITHGLQDARSSRRILRASDVLRKQGVGTEFLIAFSEPEWLACGDTNKSTDEVELLGRAQYKHYVANRGFNELDSERQTLEVRRNIGDAVERTAYYVSLRGMDSPYRLWDVINSPKIAAQVRAELSKGGEVIDERTYYRDHLIPALAKNMVKMHTSGLAHRYLHGGNISAHGSIVDLDSVHGEPLGLGDDPISEMDVVNDLTWVLLALPSVDPLEHYKTSTDLTTHQGEFLRTYMTEMLATSGDIERVDALLSDIRVAILYLGGEGDLSVPENILMEINTLEKDLGITHMDANLGTTEFGDFFVDNRQSIEDLVVENVRLHPFDVAEQLFDGIGSQWRNLIDNGDFATPLSIFKHMYPSAVDGALYEAYLSAALEIWDNTHIGDDDTRGEVLGRIAAHPAFAIETNCLQYEMTKVMWEKIHSIIVDYLDEATKHRDKYIGRQHTTRFLSHKGNVIQGAYATVEDLRSLLANPTYPVRVLDPTALIATNSDYLYIVEPDKKVLQCVTFGSEDDRFYGYSYNPMTGDDKLDIALEDQVIALFFVELEDGSLAYELYAKDPSVFTHTSFDSPERFEAEYYAKYPQQLKLV